MPEVVLDSWWFRHLSHLSLPAPPFGDHPLRLASRLMSYTVEPVPNHLWWLDGSGFADEDEESGLKSVFGVVVIAEDTMTYAPNH